VSDRAPRTGYRDGFIEDGGTYHPSPLAHTYDAHADRCDRCMIERTVARAGDPPWARPVPMPMPGPWDVEPLSHWRRLFAWFRYRPASWPTARLVLR
jgi:hypothetical protein